MQNRKQNLLNKVSKYYVCKYLPIHSEISLTIHILSCIVNEYIYVASFQLQYLVIQ